MILSSSLTVDTDDFVVEHLTDSTENRTLLKTFVAGKNADGLEIYLKSSALDDEGAGDRRKACVSRARNGGASPPGEPRNSPKPRSAP